MQTLFHWNITLFVIFFKPMSDLLPRLVHMLVHNIMNSLFFFFSFSIFYINSYRSNCMSRATSILPDAFVILLRR